MLRFLVRLLGTLVVAGGFIAAVVDGARFVANGVLDFTPLGGVLFAAFPRQFPLIEPGVTRHVHPLLWDPVLLSLFTAPAFAVLTVLGLILLWLGRSRRSDVGWSTRA